MKISIQTGGACDVLGADAGMKAIREAGFDIEEVLHDGEWCAVIARKR
jgi:ribosomal protein L11 methylase PrmA